MQESWEGEGDSKLKRVKNGGKKHAQELTFPLGKKAPFYRWERKVAIGQVQEFFPLAGRARRTCPGLAGQKKQLYRGPVIYPGRAPDKLAGRVRAWPDKSGQAGRVRQGENC